MKADYGWIVLVGIIVLVAVLWKPLTPLFTKVGDKMGNKDQYEAGKAVFFDGDRWVEGSGHSCATCHAPNWTPPEGVTVKMAAYKEGEPHLLKSIGKKYSGGVMGDEEELYDKIMYCVTHHERMASFAVSRRLDYVQDLMFYVRRQ